MRVCIFRWCFWFIANLLRWRWLYGQVDYARIETRRQSNSRDQRKQVSPVLDDCVAKVPTGKKKQLLFLFILISVCFLCFAITTRQDFLHSPDGSFPHAHSNKRADGRFLTRFPRPRQPWMALTLLHSWSIKLEIFCLVACLQDCNESLFFDWLRFSDSLLMTRSPSTSRIYASIRNTMVVFMITIASSRGSGIFSKMTWAKKRSGFFWRYF